jgi:hypothetical protein
MNPPPNAIGIKLTYGLTVLYCNRCRSREENLRTCLEALSILTGLTAGQLEEYDNPEGLHERGAKVDTYHSY